jgi:hypothetical protein
MSNPKSRCQFCGSADTLTKGHVWPKWINQILPQTATHHEQETGKFYTFDSKVPGLAHELKLRQGTARSRKPRNTCLRCNGGWMSGIESWAKYFSRHLILGYAPILPPIGQFSIAALLCLIAARLEFLGDMRAISAEDRDWLRYYREPSPNWKIWIARFDGDDGDDHLSRTYAVQHISSGPTDKIGPDYCDTRISTLVIGQLCAHIFYSRDPDLTARIAYDGIRLVQLWPASHLDLYTVGLPFLDGRGVLRLHETYVRDAPRFLSATRAESPVWTRGRLRWRTVFCISTIGVAYVKYISAENSLRDETGNFLPEQGIFSRNRELQPLTPNPCDCLLGARFFVCASTAWFVAVSGEASLCG